MNQSTEKIEAVSNVYRVRSGPVESRGQPAPLFQASAVD